MGGRAAFANKPLEAAAQRAPTCSVQCTRTSEMIQRDRHLHLQY